jgi:hypothetical protein
MAATISISLSVVALIFSIYVFINNRRADKRNTLIKMHELLISDRHQKGRFLLFEKVTDESSVERLSDEDYRDINGAISGFSLLGLYVENGYVIERDAMEAWAIPIARAWEAAKPFIAHRVNRQGYNTHVGFEPLARRAQEYLARNGKALEYKAWRQTDGAEGSDDAKELPERQTDPKNKGLKGVSLLASTIAWSMCQVRPEKCF